MVCWVYFQNVDFTSWSYCTTHWSIYEFWWSLNCSFGVICENFDKNHWNNERLQNYHPPPSPKPPRKHAYYIWCNAGLFYRASLTLHTFGEDQSTEAEELTLKRAWYVCRLWVHIQTERCKLKVFLWFKYELKANIYSVYIKYGYPWVE